MIDAPSSSCTPIDSCLAKNIEYAVVMGCRADFGDNALGMIDALGSVGTRSNGKPAMVTLANAVDELLAFLICVAVYRILLLPLGSQLKYA